MAKFTGSEGATCLNKAKCACEPDVVAGTFAAGLVVSSAEADALVSAALPEPQACPCHVPAGPRDRLPGKSKNEMQTDASRRGWCVAHLVHGVRVRQQFHRRPCCLLTLDPAPVLVPVLFRVALQRLLAFLASHSQQTQVTGPEPMRCKVASAWSAGERFSFPIKRDPSVWHHSLHPPLGRGHDVRKVTAMM